jgi:hypothetical protein
MPTKQRSLLPRFPVYIYYIHCIPTPAFEELIKV